MELVNQLERMIAETNAMIASIDTRLERTNRILAWADKDRRRFGNARENTAIVRFDAAA